MKYRIRNIVTGELCGNEYMFVGREGDVQYVGRSKYGKFLVERGYFVAEMHWSNGIYEGDLLYDAYDSVNVRVEFVDSGWCVTCPLYDEGLNDAHWLNDSKPVGYWYKDMDGKLVEVLK